MPYNFIEKFTKSPTTREDEKVILINILKKFSKIFPSDGDNPFLDDIRWIGEACTTSKEIINLLHALLAPFEHEKLKSFIMRIYETCLTEIKSQQAISADLLLMESIINEIDLCTEKDAMINLILKKLSPYSIKKTDIIQKLESLELKEKDSWNFSARGISLATNIVLKFINNPHPIDFTPQIALERTGIRNKRMEQLKSSNFKPLSEQITYEPYLYYNGVALESKGLLSINNNILQLDSFSTAYFINKAQEDIKGVGKSAINGSAVRVPIVFSKQVTERDKELKLTANFNLPLLNHCMSVLYTFGCYPALMKIETNLIKKYISQIIDLPEQWKTEEAVEFINTNGDYIFSETIYPNLQKQIPNEDLNKSIFYETGEINHIFMLIISQAPLKYKKHFSENTISHYGELILHHDWFYNEIKKIDHLCFQVGNFISRLCYQPGLFS
ncbi:MAG: hypothetical protein HKM04_02830, partial [Legionellales bacterium]|nr:hypothetical protein [Legionellales bacterium]